MAKADTVDVAAPTQDEAAEELERFGQELLAAAKDKRKRQGVEKELEAFLAKLSPKEYPDLADSPVVLAFLERLGAAKARSSDDPPGTIYNRGTLAAYKKPWQWSDLAEDKVPWVEFTCPEKIPVTYNGLTYYFQADVPVRCPKVFVDVYQEARRNRRLAHEHASYLFGKTARVSDPSIITPESAMVRGYTMAGGDPQGGWFLPGGGRIADAADLSGVGEGDSGEGE